VLRIFDQSGLVIAANRACFFFEKWSLSML
jgi:hypothetical protein